MHQLPRTKCLILAEAVIFLLVVGGVGRIVLTYDNFWQTWDEPAHIAAGMELVDRQTYTYEPFHPPLARAMAAVGLRFNGIRSTHEPSMWDEGNRILLADGQYERNLKLARIGILPFFVIASFAVALWSYSLGGPSAAVVAVALFTTLPSILGHAGVATLDMACAALVVLALLAFDGWIRKPTLLSSCLLGATVGLAILAKFSAPIFLAASGALIALAYLAFGVKVRSMKNTSTSEVKKRLGLSLVSALVCGLLIWGLYGFSVGSFDPRERPHADIDRILGDESLARDIAYVVMETVRVPAPEFFLGLKHFLSRNSEGHLAFIFGQISSEGLWYFQPIVLLLKTPIPFVILSALGVFMVVRDAVMKHHPVRVLIPLASLVAIMTIGMLANVQNGTRQVLAIYPLAAIISGFGAAKLIQISRGRYRHACIGGVALLLTSQAVGSLAAHPDYLAYFNVLAGENPERIVVGSDLDWGQDLKRLAETLEARGIDKISIRYSGSIGLDLDDFDFPTWKVLQPYNEVTGWVAISLNHLQLGTGQPPYDQFTWLKQREPVERVGKSIFLYYIQAP